MEQEMDAFIKTQYLDLADYFLKNQGFLPDDLKEELEFYRGDPEVEARLKVVRNERPLEYKMEPVLTVMLPRLDWPEIVSLCLTSPHALQFCERASVSKVIQNKKREHLEELQKFSLQEWEWYCRERPPTCKMPQVKKLRDRALSVAAELKSNMEGFSSSVLRLSDPPNTTVLITPGKLHHKLIYWDFVLIPDAVESFQPFWDFYLRYPQLFEINRSDEVDWKFQFIIPKENIALFNLHFSNEMPIKYATFPQ
jgi:hypothetical protein